MKIAHLILAHAEPEQLARLVRRLYHPDAFIFIHIDKKADINVFRQHLQDEQIHWINERIDVKGGTYSRVQATLNGIEHIINSGVPAEYINLLSGADYPLKSAADIHQFFDITDRLNFMEYQQIRYAWKEAMERVTKYHLNSYSFPGKYLVQKWMNRLLPDRKMPENLIPVGRSQWFSITMEAARYILDYLKEHPKVVRFYKMTWAPEEMIFQTILFNSDMKKTMSNNNLRFIDFPRGTVTPKIIDETDIRRIVVSGLFYGRKFDMKNHPEVMDRLDAMSEL